MAAAIARTIAGVLECTACGRQAEVRLHTFDVIISRLTVAIRSSPSSSATSFGGIISMAKHHLLQATDIRNANG